MPIYEYQCECGTLFERMSKRGFSGMTRCACGQEAHRVMPQEVGGVLDFKVQGPGPQNTGSSLDVDIDRVIGGSAQQGWAVQEVRDKDRGDLLAEHPSKNSYDLTRRPEGTFEVLDEATASFQKRARVINLLAMDALKRARANKPG